MPQISSKRTRQFLLTEGLAIDPDMLPDAVQLYGLDGLPINLNPVSVPQGGTTGQVLVKDSDVDYDIEWVDPVTGLPAGGGTGQVLAKISPADGNVGWINPPSGIPDGGAIGQVLAKATAANKDVTWNNGLPVGGALDQILAKASAGDRDVKWSAPPNVVGLVTLDPWHQVGAAGEPAFQNSWVNVGASDIPAAFRKSSDGKVDLRGNVKSGVTGTTVFTLPVGYRPAGGLIARYTTVSYSGSYGASQVTVDGATGIVSIVNAGSTWTSLTGIEFDTDTVIQTASVGAQPIDTVHLVGGAGEPAFQNSWVNFGAGNPALAFRKFPDGTVNIRGMVKTGATGTVVFTLPVGYRPPSDLAWLCFAANATGYVGVSANGNVTLNNYASGSSVTAWANVNLNFDTEGVSSYTAGIIGPPLVNVLPANPIDGQECYYQSTTVVVGGQTMAQIGLVWHLRYNVNSPSLYKWEFVGGNEIISNVPTDQARTAGGANNDLATVGPSVTVPLLGDYVYQATINTYVGAAGISSFVVASPPGTSVTEDQAQIYLAAAALGSSISLLGRLLAQPAGREVRIQYFSPVAANFRFRKLMVRPLRVSS